MRYWGLTVLGLAIAGAAVVGADWGLFHVVRTGTCASGGPYVSARPCPPGTGLHILAITGGVFGGLLGIFVYGVRGPGGRPSRIGLGVIMWSLLFITISGSILLAAFGPAAKGSPGGHLVAIILAAIFVPLGLAPWVTGAGRGDAGSSQPTPGFVPRSSPPPVAGGSNDPLDRIAKLGQLRDRGLLSPEEFEEQKRRLLDEV